MNNFDKSSTGIDIELNISYDTFMSQIDWNESFNEVVSSGYRTSGIYQYTEYGDIEKMNEGDYKAIHPQTLRRDILNWILEYDDWNYWSRTELRAMKKDELIELIQDNVLNEYDLEEAQEEANNRNVMIVLDDYEVIKTRGYSQGDYAEVIIPNKYVGDVEKHIDHLFWDAPISARGEVNGEDFYIDEHMKDRYEWDIDEAKKIVATKFDFDQDVIDAICEMLPESPSYD